MNRSRYESGLVILILLSALMHLPQVQAITPQEQTISIIDTHDDKFITEAGIGIDTYLCHIMDPTMDITSYLVFRELEINWWEPLKNATLRFRTTVSLDFEADSSVTIYGMKFSNLQDEGVISPDFVLSVPITSAYVDVNTSQFYGQQWHEVNVTNIVEELIRSHTWDGDGHAGIETGDSIGFIIFGAEGYDTRWFIDYYYGTPSLASQLVIHWNHEPPPPVGVPSSASYNETLGNWTIWSSTSYEILTEEYYDWSNPMSVISLQNDYLLILDDYSWDTWYPPAMGYQYHGLDRIEKFNNYTDSMEVRYYSKIVTEYVITHRPDWFFIALKEYGDDLIILSHYIHPGSSAGAHYIGIYQEGGSPPSSGIHYDNDGDEWWTTWKINKTHTILSTHTGTNEPDWENDIPDQTHTWQMTHTEGDENFTYYFRIAESKAGQSSYDGKLDFLLGYVSVLIDDIPVSDVDWWAYDKTNNETYGPFDNYDDTVDFIETFDPDPEDPDPGGQWSEGPGGPTGPFTRFKFRLYLLILGFGCLFGPILFFAWRRPSLYYMFCGSIIILIDIGLLLSIGQV